MCRRGFVVICSWPLAGGLLPAIVIVQVYTKVVMAWLMVTHVVSCGLQTIPHTNTTTSKTAAVATTRWTTQHNETTPINYDNKVLAVDPTRSTTTMGNATSKATKTALKKVTHRQRQWGQQRPENDNNNTAARRWVMATTALTTTWEASLAALN
ncbi:hypothetical protein EDB83DRAFT_2318754 [Lactarius deliciosus]|nr:hypothetical protein EDB83DRAFT_2318754 [Lactarius deliciosus]